MTPSRPRSRQLSPIARPRRRALGALGSLGLAAAGCGGTDVAGVGSGGTGQIAAGSYTVGAITGFGSVIVNGIRYDDSSASITDDRGGLRSRDDLRLGMVVEIEGSTDDTARTGTARAIRVVGELRGPVSAIDRATSRFTVLGTTVQYGPSTVWEHVDGPASLAVGVPVEVHGYADRAAGVLRATRVEPNPGGDRPSMLRGLITELDRTLLTGRIGSQALDLRGVALPATLAIGTPVQVTAAGAPVPGVPWPVERLDVLQTVLGPQVAVVRLDGRISGLASTRFELAGLQVDTAAATFEGGTAAALANGLRVRVLGTLAGGRVAARLVEIRAEDSDSEEDEVEVRGTVERVGAQGAFSLRDAAGRVYAVETSAQTRFDDGATVADLRVGARVEVKALRGLVLRATRIKIESAG